jgi:hypothetical protein
MQLTLDLPDEVSAVLAASGQDLSRAAFEAIALEAYRERKLTTAQLRRLLGFESRYELDGFLRQHEVRLEYGWQDLEHDREAHDGLGACEPAGFCAPLWVKRQQCCPPKNQGA